MFDLETMYVVSQVVALGIAFAVSLKYTRLFALYSFAVYLFAIFLATYFDVLPILYLITFALILGVGEYGDEYKTAIIQFVGIVLGIGLYTVGVIMP